MYRELQEEILRNPVHADMVARGLESIKLSSGKTIGDLNPWLGEFIRATDEAMHIEPGRQHPRGNEIWLTHRSGDGETIFVTEEFRKYTGLTCVLLDRLVKKGVYSWTSEKNFCLNYVAEGSITRTEWSSYQEARPSLVLSYLRKDGKSEFTVGFNLLDKRFEIFSREKEGTKETTSPEESSPAPTTPAPTEPSHGPVPTTEPSRGPVPTKPKGGGGGGGGTTPAPTTPGGDDGHQRKDPAAAPVNKGNAQQGGGDNRSSDGPGVFQPQDPATESRIGNANDNGHGHSNPKTVTPVTPQPEGPATGAQQPIAATQESKMNYETDSQSQNTSWKDSQTGQTTNHTQPATSVEYGIVNTEAAKPVTSSAAGDAQQLAEPPID